MVTNFHKLILEKFSYEAKNTLGNKHELSYKSDSAVLAAYTVISLYNALTMIFPVLAISGSTGGAPSWITIILNVVVLIRLNIGTYIKKKECEDNASDELRGKGIVNKIDIKTWQIRLGIIIAGYIIDILIAIYYLCYGKVIADSLAVIGIVAIVETFIDGILNNWVARYEAVPEIFIKA